MEQEATKKQLLIFILIAYTFSVALRFIWVDFASAIDDFFWNGQLMINTNDGYYFAEVARNALVTGEQTYAKHNGAVSVPTVFLSTYLPASFETIILYMPTFFGSLLVIPLILIGATLRQPFVGFIAALTGSVTWSYYNRTMTGYYDSDMLNIVLPMMVLWSLLFTLKENRNRYLLLIPLFLLVSEWWYLKNIALNTAMIFMLAIYTLVWQRRKLFNYKILAFATISLIVMPLWVKLILLLGLFALFHFKPEFSVKLVIPILITAILGYLFSGAAGPVLSSLKLYVINRLFADTLPQLLYYDVINTVREAGAIPFETFANRISGHVVSFLIASVGVVWMIVRYPQLIIALPMVAMGFMAYKAGLRFTVYAVPIYAFGIGFLIMVLSASVKRIVQGKYSTVVQYMFATLLTAIVLYPNLQHIINYKVPTVFNKNEVMVLDALKSVASRGDYALSWWDYGYPIRYYADVKTLVDGGAHTGELNYPISKALIENQTVSANIARLDVEYAVNKKQSMKYFMQDYGITDPNDFMMVLDDKQFRLPPRSRDIFYYLPIRMLDILPTVALFGNIDLRTGKQLERLFSYQTSNFKDSGESVDFGNGIVLNKKNSTLRLGNHDVPVRRVVTTGYEGNRVVSKVQNLNAAGPLSIIVLRNYNRVLILDEKYYNSTYVQLALLEQYDKELFEPVELTPYAKIYRLKR